MVRKIFQVWTHLWLRVLDSNQCLRAYGARELPTAPTRNIKRQRIGQARCPMLGGIVSTDSAKSGDSHMYTVNVLRKISRRIKRVLHSKSDVVIIIAVIGIRNSCGWRGH